MTNEQLHHHAALSPPTPAIKTTRASQQISLPYITKHLICTIVKHPTVQVGSGKSSILAALLGELQPLGLQPCTGGSGSGSGGAEGASTSRAQVAVSLQDSSSSGGGGGAGGASVPGSPLMAGTVAYCAQVRCHLSLVLN